MVSSQLDCSVNHRLVGDPVDVVTGAQTDVTFDFKFPGPLPVVWNRYYSTGRRLDLLPLGYGHTHEYDRRLTLDLDGATYTSPSGDTIGFPDLGIGRSQARLGFVLSRPAEFEYHLLLPDGDRLEFAFSRDQAVAPLKRFVRGNDALSFSYSENGRLIEIVDALKRSLLVVADPSGRIANISSIGAPGTATGTLVKKKTLVSYDYDSAGNLVRVKDTFGFVQAFQYDERRLMTRRTDRKNYSFLFSYDARGRCIHSRGEDGMYEVQLEYDPPVKATYVRKGGKPPFTYFYNDAGTITQIVDPYGGATKFVVDDNGRVVEEIDPAGNVARFHYDATGRHTHRIDPNGHALPPLEHDPDKTDPLAYQLPETPLEWEFGSFVDAATIKTPDAGDPVLALFPAAVVNTVLGKTATYDPKAMPIPGTLAKPAETLDDFGRTLEDIGPRFTERWKYDPNGNPIEHQDRDGGIRRLSYTSWNALHEEKDPLGNTVVYAHTSEKLVSRVTDPGGTVIEYAYDFKDRLVEIRQNGVVQESYRYDAAANVVEKLDAQGRRLVSWTMVGALDAVRSFADGTKHVFQHDDRGRITEAAADSGTATCAYDAGGRLVADLRDGRGVTHEFDLLRLVKTTYFGAFRVVYETDANGDVAITDPVGGRHRVKRGPSGLIARLYANGTRELCQFDADGRCARKAIVRTAAEHAFVMRSYLYSGAGDLLAIAEAGKGTTHFHYDAAHRLKEEVLPNGMRRRFEFDASGNLLLQDGLANVAIDRGNRRKEANGESFTYNDRGHISSRRSSKKTTRYEYDSQDMLTKCDLNGEEWSATYDAFCRRVSKTWLGRTTVYYWDGFRLAAEVQHDGAARLYVYHDEAALVPFLFVEYNSLEASPESGRRYYVFANQVGAPFRVDDDAGTTCWSAKCDPYGQVAVSEKSTLTMPLRFPGHYHDAETGLHYNRFRYFSPELGCYIQSDPAGQIGGVNLYAYPVNPLIGVDIDGLKAPARASGNKSKKPPPAKGKGKGKGKGDGKGDDACPLRRPPPEPHPTKAEMQALVDQAVKDLKANPGLAKDLMSPGSYAHLVNNTKLAPASFGKAVERRTAQLVAAQGLPVAHTGRTRGENGQFISSPDFKTKDGRTFDVTTNKDVAPHEKRNENNDKKPEYLTYDKPPDLKFPK